MKEIAFQTGYPDAFTFSKAFRRHCHCTPRAYRSHGSKERSDGIPLSTRS